ncbi:hypothetical protein HQQ94_22190 [Shewanella sp. VB17]|uniref:hypothetical protein n=1 Tax=Shewanella sp. VB17 TaxID=2739432 RepID=UPI00156379B5|nr:hypothetical protein [Shewanella sp. VB17]NRD75872.1 hypothetical protein [Shewanella sp. VB17]
MKKLIIGGVITSLCACAMTENSAVNVKASLAPVRVTLNGMTNEDAISQLYEALIQKNYLATMGGDNRIAVMFNENQFLLQLSINPDGIDRIMMNCFYAVHPKLVGSKDLLVLIATLNHKLNFAKFTLREQGAVIQVQGAATFVNTIELEEIRRLMLWTDEGLKQVGLVLPKGIRQLIKPIAVIQ